MKNYFSIKNLKIHFLKIFKWMLLLLVVASTIILIYRNRNDFHFILKIDYNYIIIILFLSFINLSLGSLRYFLIIRTLSNHVDFWSCYKAFIIGRFLNKIIPRSGVIYRALYFKKKNKISYKKLISGFIAFMFLDIMIYMLIGSIVIGIYDHSLSIGGTNLLFLFILLFFLNISIAYITYLVNKHLHFSVKNALMKKFFFHLKNIVNNFINLCKNKKILMFNFSIILSIFLVNIGLIHLCFRSVHIYAKISLLSVFVVLSQLSTVITLTPGNLGVRELLYAFLANSMGIGSAEGLSVSIILRISGFIIIGTLSLFFILSEKSFKSVKKLEINDS